MARFLVVWFAVSFGLAGLWAAAVLGLSGLPCLRRWTEPPDPGSDAPRLVIFSASSNATAERECLRALEELWEASQ